MCSAGGKGAKGEAEGGEKPVDDTRLAEEQRYPKIAKGDPGSLGFKKKGGGQEAINQKRPRECREKEKKKVGQTVHSWSERGNGKKRGRSKGKKEKLKREKKRWFSGGKNRQANRGVGTDERGSWGEERVSTR